MQIIDFVGKIDYDVYAFAQHSIPYYYEICNGTKKLKVLGVEHTTEPSSDTYKYIRQNIMENAPDLVMVEGMSQISNEKYISYFKTLSQEYIISNYGENAFAMFFAWQHNIDVISPEPKLQEEVKYLLSNGYKDTDVWPYYMLRFLYQWERSADSTSIEEYLEKGMNYLGQEIDFFHYTTQQFYDALESLKKEYQGKDIFEVIPCVVDPIYRTIDGVHYKTKYNTISRLSSMFRDYTLMESVMREKEIYNKVLLVYGYSHAYLLQKIFEKSF